MSHASRLSRQDTLPTKDPSWSYSPVPGQPAPIPPRNEPLLFISTHTAHANASFLENHSVGNPHIETWMASSIDTVMTSNPDPSDKHAVGPKGLDDVFPLRAMASLAINETTSLQASDVVSSPSQESELTELSGLLSHS